MTNYMTMVNLCTQNCVVPATFEKLGSLIAGIHLYFDSWHHPILRLLIVLFLTWPIASVLWKFWWKAPVSGILAFVSPGVRTNLTRRVAPL